MGAVIQFPKDRIVRPLRKRVARPRAKPAAPLAAWQIEARKCAAAAINCAVRKGLTLEQIQENLRRAQPFKGDRMSVYISDAMVEEIAARLGKKRQQANICRLVEVLERQARDPASKFAQLLKAREERHDRMAQLVVERAIRKGKPTTKEKARAALDQAIDEVKR